MRYIYTIYTIYTKYTAWHSGCRCIFSSVPTTPKRSRQPAVPVVSNVGTRCIASCQVSMKNSFSVSKNYVNVGHTRKCKLSTIHTIHYHTITIGNCFYAPAGYRILSSTHMIGRNLIIAFSKKHYSNGLHWRPCLRNCPLGNKLLLVSSCPKIFKK